MCLIELRGFWSYNIKYNDTSRGNLKCMYKNLLLNITISIYIKIPNILNNIFAMIQLINVPSARGSLLFIEDRCVQ